MAITCFFRMPVYKLLRPRMPVPTPLRVGKSRAHGIIAGDGLVLRRLLRLPLSLGL